MTKTSTSIARFDKMHRNFSESYKIINEYVVEVYLLPKKLIDETEPAVDQYIRECVIPGEPRANMTSLPVVIEFIDDLDQFADDTQQLYDVHKKHLDKSTLYLQKLSGLKTGIKSKKTLAAKTTYTQLGKELVRLNRGLKSIKEKADEVVYQLEKLELNWGKIKNSMRQ